MEFIHAREHAIAGDVAVVECSHQCNVWLMDDSEFAKFKRGGRHSYFGGFFRMLPARIRVPSTGFWNVVIHLGGGRAAIRYGINIIRG